MAKGRKPRPLAERFWEKVDTSAGPDACWPWRSHINKATGYGTFYVARRKIEYAHRMAYTLTHGAIPDGMTIDHVRSRGCTRTDCCNPAHLEVVTHRENILRGNNMAARFARRTHCDKGHPLTPETIVPSYLRRGFRTCRTCYNQYHRERRANAKQRAA